VTVPVRALVETEPDEEMVKLVAKSEVVIQELHPPLVLISARVEVIPKVLLVPEVVIAKPVPRAISPEALPIVLTKLAGKLTLMVAGLMVELEETAVAEQPEGLG
jgi:hypothetical protein